MTSNYPPGVTGSEPQITGEQEQRFTVRREVVETIEIDAYTEEEAEQSAAASPVELWTRDIKEERVVDEQPLTIVPRDTCPECGRVFDLTNATDADEWFNGHDCEVQS
jgi:hypothetical protein